MNKYILHKFKLLKDFPIYKSSGKSGTYITAKSGLIGKFDLSDPSGVTWEFCDENNVVIFEMNYNTIKNSPEWFELIN